MNADTKSHAIHQEQTIQCIWHALLEFQIWLSRRPVDPDRLLNEDNPENGDYQIRMISEFLAEKGVKEPTLGPPRIFDVCVEDWRTHVAKKLPHLSLIRGPSDV